jgi:hypothetical protein
LYLFIFDEMAWHLRVFGALETTKRLGMKNLFLLDAGRRTKVGKGDSVRFHFRIDSSARGDSRRFFFGRNHPAEADHEIQPIKRNSWTNP